MCLGSTVLAITRSYERFHHYVAALQYIAVRARARYLYIANAEHLLERPVVTNLYLWRRANNWTQAQAAAEIHTTRNVYQAMETGRMQPTPAQFELLRKYFGPRKASAMLAAVRSVA